MTTTRNERHRRLLALAFAFASTCVSFTSTLELLNLPTRHLPVFLESDPETLDT
jgi:hypothetical protein